MKYRCYDLYENITDGRGLAYRYVKSTNLIGAILYFLSPKYGHGKRIEFSTDLATEILQKKGTIRNGETI